MSSVGNVRSSTELSQLFQRLSRQAEAANGTSAAGTRQTDSSRRADFEAKILEAALAAGLDPSAANGLKDEINSAISAATKNSDGTTDEREAVKNAVDSVLQQHGVDLEKFRSQMQPPQGGAGSPPPGGPPPGGPPPGDGGGGDLKTRVTEAAVAAGLDSSETDSIQEQMDSIITSLVDNSDDTTDTKSTIQEAIDKLLAKHGVDLNEFRQQMQAGSGGTDKYSLVDERA